MVAIIIASFMSCERSPYTTSHVCNVEKMTISYKDWLCGSVVIDKFPWHCKYPLQYEQDIRTGMLIHHQCDSMIAFKGDAGWVQIDWESCKRQDHENYTPWK